MRIIEKQVIEVMSYRKRTGSKISKQEKISKAVRFVLYVATEFPNVKRIEQIGRKHIHVFYDSLVSKRASSQDLYRYSLAIEALWHDMDRAGRPPRFNHKGVRQ